MACGFSIPPVGWDEKIAASRPPQAAAANRYTHHRPARSLTSRRTIGIPMIIEKIVIRIPDQRKMPSKFTGDLDRGDRTQDSVNTMVASSDDLSKDLINAPSLALKPVYLRARQIASRPVLVNLDH
jgi:hypothetical protein